MPEQKKKKKKNYTNIVVSAKTSFGQPVLENTLIKKRAFESFRRFLVFDG